MASNGNGGGPHLVVKGLRGFLRGEERVLSVGEAIVIGRSRAAGLSTRKSRILESREDWRDVISSEPFLTVSRSHVRIHFLHPHVVEVKDVSANGTFLDGKRIDCVALTDLHRQSHILAVGAQERFKLDVVADEDEEDEDEDEESRE